MFAVGSGWSRGKAFLMMLLAILVLSPLLLSTASAAPAPAQPELDAAPQQSGWSAPRTVYIPESGHTIDGVFLDFWRAAGGAAAYGNPISAEFTRNNRIVQYYEYARFEYVPDDPNGVIVQVGDIGRDLRPQLVIRSLANGTSSEAIEELSLFSRAWLPVSSNLASKPATADWVYVPETGHTVAFGFKALWERIGQTYLGFPLTEEYILGGVTRQVFERGQLAWTQERGAWLVPIGIDLAARQSAPMEPEQQGNIPTYDEALFVPPAPPKPEIIPGGGEVWIDVNLSWQYMTLYQGSREVLSSYVSTGRPGWDTPAGTFFINAKYLSHDMAGSANGETWFVPDVPWAMYFTSRGHALHGTYWHSNFGSVMSHGCVNLPMGVAEFVYNVTGIGTRVEVHW